LVEKAGFMTQGRSASDGSIKVLARPAFRGGEAKPYNLLLYSSLTKLGVQVREFRGYCVARERTDLLHIHWPESLIEAKNLVRAWLTAQEYRLSFRVARRRGIKIVWTIHDLVPHDVVYPGIELPFWQDFIDRADGVIALTQSGLNLARQRYARLGEVPAFVIPHGHFREVYPRTLSREQARQMLGISGSDFVLTFFGQIRPYKNVPRLIRAFRDLEDPQLRLFVCGRLSKRVDLGEEIQAAASADPRIRLVLRYIEANEIERYLMASDLVVLPYSEILNSGSAFLGLSFDRPILVPDAGALPELRRAVGKEWVRTYQGEIDACALQQAIIWARQCSRAPRAPLDEFNWERIGLKTLAAYQEIMRSTP
jgi:beta-1,4-mannosyltransferase